LQGAIVVNRTATTATLADARVLGDATDVHRDELAAYFEVVASTVSEGKNVHPEFSDAA
jgi:hypothetical protein